MHLKSATARAGGPLLGVCRVPGDKSISHRALLFALLALGQTRIEGLLEGEDVLATAAAVRALGGAASRSAEGVWHVTGVGIGGLHEPEDVLDMGNSGTAARLLIGLVSSHPITTLFTGDHSLRKRPMARVTQPLAGVGATFLGRSGGRLPLAVKGNDQAPPIEAVLTVASAQVKSALLLAGLNLPGTSVVVDPFETRDHTENMLRHFGARIDVTQTPEGARISVVGQPELTARDVHVPADPSSAAFPAVAALLVPGSRITLPGVCLNPTRAGLYDVLRQMGADIAVANPREEGGEPVADLQITSAALSGVDVPAQMVPRMVDEFPILAVAAANADGHSRFRGLEELRVKESDRLAAIAAGLTAIGVTCAIEGDDLLIEGCGPGQVPGGNTAPVTCHFDHRIAMSFLVAGLASRAPVRVDDITAIATSFPNFFQLMAGLGADLAAD